MSKEFLLGIACDLVNEYDPYEAGDIIPSFESMDAYEIADQIGQMLDRI